MNKIKIVGIGPGHPDYVLPIAYRAVEEATLLIGSARHLEIFTLDNKRTYNYDGRMMDLCDFINRNLQEKMVILVSGDTGFYSLLDFLKNTLDESIIEVIPGISSFQYIFSKIKESYKDYGLYSVHGRSYDALSEWLDQAGGIFLLTDKENTPSRIARKIMIEKGVHYRMIVGENLSYEDEVITIGPIQEFTNHMYSPLSVVIIDGKI